MCLLAARGSFVSVFEQTAPVLIVQANQPQNILLLLLLSLLEDSRLFPVELHGLFTPLALRKVIVQHVRGMGGGDYQLASRLLPEMFNSQVMSCARHSPFCILIIFFFLNRAGFVRTGTFFQCDKAFK